VFRYIEAFEAIAAQPPVNPSSDSKQVMASNLGKKKGG
jgi:hypothetical protein